MSADSIPAELWVTRAVYARIMEAARIEQGRTENAASSGSMMRAMVREYIPETFAPELPRTLKIVVKPWLPFPAVYLGSDRVRDAMKLLEAHNERSLVDRLDQRISLRIWPATDTHCGIAGTSAKCPLLRERELDLYCEAFGYTFEYDENKPGTWPERLAKCKAAAIEKAP